MDAQTKAREIFNWVADTQFNVIFDSDGNIVKRSKLTEIIRHRAKTYVYFILDNVDDLSGGLYWNDVKNHIDSCYYKK